MLDNDVTALLDFIFVNEFLVATTVSEEIILVRALQRIFVMVVSSTRGFIMEFIGRIIIENSAYQGVASITPAVCRLHIITNGIQQQKSVAMIRETCLFRSFFLVFLLLFFIFSEDLVEAALMNR